MENDKGPWAINGLDNSSTDDLIKFVFEAVSNESPGKSIALFFRAYLNGGITDNHGASWNGFKYLGRGEEFFTYQGFTRTLSFSFKVFAASSEELEPMYNRVHALASQVYPDYSPIGVMRAPVMRLTIGDYLHRMPGLLESVNITTENAGFEITDGKQLPMALNISVGFKPIPEKIPRRFNTALVPQLFANKVIADETRAALFNPASSNERIQKEEDKYAKDLAKRGALVEDREADPPSNQISSPTIEYPPNLNAGGGSRIELNNASNANAESAFNLFGASNYDKIPGGK
jgi:hypothetical protein